MHHRHVRIVQPASPLLQGFEKTDADSGEERCFSKHTHVKIISLGECKFYLEF